MNPSLSFGSGIGVNYYDGVFSNQNLEIGIWTNVIGIYYNGAWNIYFNGVLNSTSNGIFASPDIPCSLFFGNSGNNIGFNGDLDDIGIWNRALTQQEITDLYNGTSAHTNENSLPLASVHPNPTTREITITSNDLHSQFYSLYNSLGQLVASGMLNAENTTLSIQEFAPGIYTLQLQGEKNTTLKIVKE